MYFKHPPTNICFDIQRWPSIFGYLFRVLRAALGSQNQTVVAAQASGAAAVLVAAGSSVVSFAVDDEEDHHVHADEQAAYTDGDDHGQRDVERFFSGHPLLVSADVVVLRHGVAVG